MPLYFQFASGRSNSESPVVAAVAGGNLSATTIWIGLQKRNRVGHNRISPLVQVTATAGQKIQVQIPASARLAGEDWHEFTIVAAASNNPQQTYKVASVKGYQAGAAIALPHTIELTEDSHLEFAPNVATPASLPANANLIEGMVRGVTSTGFYYFYDPDSTATPDGLTVFSATPSGRWLRSDLPQTYITNLRGNGGCDIAAKDVDPSVAKPYAVDGSQSDKVAYWLINDNPLSSGAFIPQGARINLGFAQDGIDVSNGLSGKMGVIFQGHWDGSTLIASMSGAGGSSTYYNGADGAFVLQQDLQPGQAWAFQVYAQVGWYELQNLVPDGAVISVSAKLYQASGVPSEVGFLLGDFLAAEGQKGRVYPGNGLTAIVGSRSGVVANHVFNKVGTSLIGGLLENTADQIVAIDSNGNAFVPFSSLPISARKRALVSTEVGISNPGAWSASVNLAATGRVKVTCNHPVNVADKGIVRSDYPDIIAGDDLGEFNPYSLTVYVRRVSDGQIRSFPGYLALTDLSQDIELGDWSAGTVVGSLPASPSADFSLYAPGSTTVLGISGGGNFTAGSYQATFAYGYNGSQVTKVHHSVDSTYIYEADRSLSELFAHAGDLDNPHQTGFATFAGSVSLVTPDFVDQIWLATDTNQIYRATGTNAGDLVAAGSGGSSFVQRLITTMVFA